MNTFFVGQTGILGASSNEKRVYRLAQELGARGHNAVAFTATHKQLRRFNGFSVNYTPSLIPETPGGWLYTGISMWKAAMSNPDVIHISSWKAAAAGILAALISPKATFIWTVDTLPTNSIIGRRLIVWLATRLYDAILAPTRNLQYQFRLVFGILPTYIPDGYDQSSIPAIPATYWKLRKNQYLLAITDDNKTIKTLMAAYKLAKSRKKLIVLTHAITPKMRRTAKQYPLLRLIEATTPRQRASLIQQAKAIILPDTTTTQEELLIAMDAGQPIASIGLPLFQEITGTTAQFFDLDDEEHTVELLQGMATQKSDTNKKAQRRARAHFTWIRIFDEYETFYHYPVIRRVAIDSIGANRIIASVPQR